MLDYRLQVFREVAELQSVTKAARTLHLSQPAVTKHIQLLEAQLTIAGGSNIDVGNVSAAPRAVKT